ncbi:MAG: 2-oxoglutarate dehydrogenase E1 component [Lentisphaeria bacterium]|nr:2-oxoglutarate dehydrogenase E1 component [Lentisphaeria bacterium]
MNNKSSYSHANLEYIDMMYENYQEDPNSVDEKWQNFFEGVQFAGAFNENNSGGAIDKEVAVMKLITAYRSRGHLIAQTNPIRRRRLHPADLNLEYFGLDESDLDTVFEVATQIHIGASTLREILQHLHETYCDSIGVEFRFIQNSKLRIWMHENMEPIANNPVYSNEHKKQIYKKLVQAVGFEKFLGVKYVGQKRFSLEGIESFIPAMHTLFEEGARLGAKEFVVGMAHRGRLNVLCNLFDRSYEDMLAEFEGADLPEGVNGEGDVKYHRGHSADVTTSDGHPLHLSLAFNPSHLEAIDPVVFGMAKGKNDTIYDNDPKAVVPILVHGDAAIAGQGVVYEIANMCDLEGYSVGGAIHIVLNNQVGFTANYRETRSSMYCTDIAKVTGCPVFHVNADDVDAVVHATTMAIRLRQEFHTDVYIDILGYRRYGHNEGDDPRFTQPILYEAIRTHPNVLDIYKEKLVAAGDISPESADGEIKEFKNELNTALDKVRAEKPSLSLSLFGRNWEDFRFATQDDFEVSPETGISRERISAGIAAMGSIPQGFRIYPKLRRILDYRSEVYGENKLDWGMAELLAFGTLLEENHYVRITGQDSRRGTFAHRHAVLYDNRDESVYIPINHISEDQNKLQIYNSHLSEYGVMGYEYGVSLAVPNGLTIWEAQFGDFSNGAQIILDQFVSSSENKWQRMSGFTMFLPHGYEGQGPEHSSARLERYLQLCADLNMRVCVPTSAANLFHMLRRQLKSDFRKPLVVMTPKSFLRSPDACSPIEDFLEGTKFEEIIHDKKTVAKNARRVVLCTGKIYFELLKYREEQGIKDVALVRLEQLYPFPLEQDKKLIRKYKDCKDWLWVQEEPENMGAWDFIFKRYRKQLDLEVVARPASSSPAGASPKQFKAMQQHIIEQAFK